MKITPETRIILPYMTLAILETACNQAWPNEVSGVAFVDFDKDGDIIISMPQVLNVMSEGYTEIQAHLVAEVMAMYPNLTPYLKCWWHRHPIQGWSGTDEHTATKTPMGNRPEMVGWAVAIVRTPTGWIGRLDVFDSKGNAKTYHLPVYTGFEGVVSKTTELKMAYLAAHPGQKLSFWDDGDWEELAEELDDEEQPHYVLEVQNGQHRGFPGF